MEICVRSLSSHLCTLSCLKPVSALDVKRHVETHSGIPHVEVSLILFDRELEDAEILPFQAACGTLELTMIRYDPDLVAARQAVRSGELALDDVPAHFRNDRQIVLEAVRNNGFAYRCASDSLKEDHTVAMAAVRKNGSVLKLMSSALKDDFDVVLAAVSNDGLALRHASERMRRNREVVFAAVTCNGTAIHDVSDEWAHDRELVLAAVHDTFLAIPCLRIAFLSDRAIAKAAVSKHGASAFRYFPEVIKCDREIALTAVRTDPQAFYWYTATPLSLSKCFT